MDIKSSLEEKLKIGYEEYLKLPKAETRGINKYAEIYSKKWCVITGRTIIHPHPHRQYTFVEFAFYCGNNPTLYDRFIK